MPLLKLNRELTRRLFAVGLVLTLAVGMMPPAGAKIMVRPTDTVTDTVPGDATDGDVDTGMTIVPPAGEAGDGEMGETDGDTGSSDTDTGDTPLIPLVPAEPVVENTKIVIPVGPPQADGAKLPTIQIWGNLVMNTFDEYTGKFELSIRANSGTDDPFRAAGAVIKYNTDYLTPVDWNSQPIDLSKTTANYDTVFPAKKPDNTSGAAGWIGGTEGYLYLEAESTPGVETSIGTPLALVQFTLKKPLTYDGATGKYMDDVTEVALFSFVDEITDPACFTGARAQQALWYESDTTPFYHLPDFAGKGTAPVMLPVPNAAGTTDDVEFQRPNTVGMVVQAVKIPYDPAMDAPTDYYSFTTNHLDDTHVLLINESGLSNSGAGDGITLDEVFVAAVVDWQNTLIGAAPLAKGVSANTVAKQVDALIGTMYEGYNPTANADQPSWLKKQNVTTTALYDKTAEANAGKYPLTAKKGYNFAGFVLTTPETMENDWTAYDTADLANCLAALTNAATVATKVDTVYLKATYVGNEELNKHTILSDASTRTDYTYSNFSYERIDNNNFAMTFNVSRRNLDRYGVSRLANPLLRVIFNIGSVEMYMQVILKSEDAQSVYFVVPASAEQFVVTIVDGDSAANYVSADARSLEGIFYDNTTGNIPNSGYGFVVESITSYMNELAYIHIDILNTTSTITGSSWNTAFGATQVTQMNLDNYINDIANQNTPGTAVGNYRNIAKNRIILYKAACGGRTLSYDETKAAVQLNTEQELTFTITAVYMAYRVQHMLRAYALNGNRDLNEIQMLALITSLNAYSAAAPMSDAQIRTELAKG